MMKGDDWGCSKLFLGKTFYFTASYKTSSQYSSCKAKLELAGGKVVERLTKQLDYIVGTSQDIDFGSKSLKDRVKLNPLVPLEYILESIEQGKVLELKGYQINWQGEVETKSGSLKLKLKRPVSPTAIDTQPSKLGKSLSESTLYKFVDSNCSWYGSAKLYWEGVVYDCTLNQTNLDANNNKFYLLQLLQKDGQFALFTRWGRVGVVGQSSLETFAGNLELAKTKFQTKFKSKSGCSFGLGPYPFQKGKYYVLELDYGEKEKEKEKEKESLIQLKPKVEVQSKLDVRVKELVDWIFDKQFIKRTLSSFNYDFNRMPLGKLTKEHITKAYLVLQHLSDAIQQPNPSNLMLMDLSSQFYTILPHSYGRTNLPLIHSIEMVQLKVSLIESLTEMQHLNQLLDSSVHPTGVFQHPSDLNYLKLNHTIVPVHPSSPTFQLVETYLRNTHANTHGWYRLQLEQLFQVDAVEKLDRFDPTVGNRQWLWHGSRLTNYVGILSQGLRIAPPEAPISGYMFGKGVYFADMVSKSANYCNSQQSDNLGLLLLCEVALGSPLELVHSDAQAQCKALNCNKHSTKGLGRTVPDPNQVVTLSDGAQIPLGSPVNVDHLNLGLHSEHLTLQFNEYIVYDTTQIKIRYLLKVKFNSTNSSHY